jgi:hypothetical protein
MRSMRLAKRRGDADAIQRALTLAPLYEEPRLALGMHYHRLGKFEEAEFAYLWAGQAKGAEPLRAPELAGKLPPAPAPHRHSWPSASGRPGMRQQGR